MAVRKPLVMIGGVVRGLPAGDSISGAGEGGDGGGAAYVFSLPAHENLDAGNFVNIFTDAGAAKVRKASASLARSADGFVASSFPVGSLAAIKPLGEPHTHSSGLTPGREYWLGESGGISEFPPSANEIYAVAQTVGVAVNTSTIKTAEKFAKTIDNATPLILIDKEINVEPGVPLSRQLQVSGGIPPYKLTKRNFPDWLSISPEGVLQGTAPIGYAAGTYGIDICDARPVCITSNISVLSGRKYWRVLFSQVGENVIQVAELKFDGVTPTGGTVFGTPVINPDGTFFTGAVFDGNPYTMWSVYYQNGLAHIGYEFPVSKNFNSISIQVRPDFTGWYPKNFTVQSSSDGINWRDEWTVIGAAIPNGGTKIFNRPAQ